MDWQIYATSRVGERVLLARKPLASRWQEAGLLPEGALQTVAFGPDSFGVIQSRKEHALTSVACSRSPQSAAEALAFAASMKRTRSSIAEVPLHDAIYVERYTVLLPTYSMSPAVADDVVLGSYLSGGVQVSCRSTRRLGAMLSWLPASRLAKVIDAAGLEGGLAVDVAGKEAAGEAPASFVLPGRPALEAFFREHVIDIVQHSERYRALGIGSPSAIVLHGPPGCGKTFAVERLVEYLGWPIYQIASGTVGSPYIHETGRKVAELFATALDHAPSAIVIDEMESFLSDREQSSGSGGHRVEEVAEFLRRIPEAVKGGVLIIGMTNRIKMIDPAILRRGRFDHIVQVTMPTEGEVRSLLDSLLAKLPTAAGLQAGPLAARLAGRPLSDAAFVVREAGRLAARGGKDHLDQQALEQALATAPARDLADTTRSRIGFA